MEKKEVNEEKSEKEESEEIMLGSTNYNLPGTFNLKKLIAGIIIFLLIDCLLYSFVFKHLENSSRNTQSPIFNQTVPLRVELDNKGSSKQDSLEKKINSLSIEINHIDSTIGIISKHKHQEKSPQQKGNI
jgi:hypothetical protein